MLLPARYELIRFDSKADMNGFKKRDDNDPTHPPRKQDRKINKLNPPTQYECKKAANIVPKNGTESKKGKNIEVDMVQLHLCSTSA